VTPQRTTSPPPAEHCAGVGLDPDRLPGHVAIIMDGNGRWAQQRGEPRVAGHLAGVLSVRRTVEECVRLGVGQLTLYCLSSENWKRPQEELNFLMTLLEKYLVEERREILDQHIRFTTIGRRAGLPDPVLREIDENVRLTRDHSGMGLCLAINYGGRTELIDAIRSLASQARSGTLDPDAIDEAAVSDALYTRGLPEPDLLIRTAGEMRLSNFLLWQVSYAELWVTEQCWPDFDEALLHQALRDYAGRVRRFGGLT